jgi:membrane fusion protein, macrolide-specific efflux system
MKRKKLAVLLAGSVIVIGAIAGAIVMRSHKNPDILTDEQVHNIITETARKGDISISVSATGTLYAYQDVIVGAQASGQIKKLNIKIGDHVKKGDLLVDIDSTTQMNTLNTDKATLASSQATLASKKVALKDATLKLNRQKELMKSNATTQDTLETATLTYEQAQADVKVAQTTVESNRIMVNTAEKNLSYTKIESPVDGIVVAVPVTEGQTVNATQTTPDIATISDMSQMKVKAQIAESDVAKIKPGMNLSFNVLGSNTRYYSKLDSVDPAPTTISDNSTISSSSTTAIYYYGNFFIKNDGQFKSYMTANVNIDAQSRKNTLLISSSAIESKNNIDTVKVLQGNRLVEKTVVVGLDNKINAEILKGLNEGDKVVLSSEKAQARMPHGPMM